MPSTPFSPIYRPFRSSDIPDLLSVYNASFKKSWHVSDFDLFMQKTDHYKLFVCEVENQCAGFLAYQTIQGEFDIITICVHPDYRRQGLAMLMIDNMIKEKDCVCINLEVDNTNKSALQLYFKMGFKFIHTRENYYKSPSYKATDALVLKYIKK